METPKELNSRTMAKYGLLVDYQWCTGCHSCEIACQMEHKMPVGKSGILVHDMGHWPSRRAATSGSSATWPPRRRCATAARSAARSARSRPACSTARRSAWTSARSTRWPRRPRATRTTRCSRSAPSFRDVCRASPPPQKGAPADHPCKGRAAN